MLKKGKLLRKPAKILLQEEQEEQQWGAVVLACRSSRRKSSTNSTAAAGFVEELSERRASRVEGIVSSHSRGRQCVATACQEQWNDDTACPCCWLKRFVLLEALLVFESK